MNVIVKDSVYDPSPSTAKSKIQVREEGGKTLYKVWLYLEGNDLAFIRNVTYRLHRTFPNPIMEVERSVSNPNCRAIIWTWGVFDVYVTITDLKGHTYERIHRLTYVGEIEGEPRVNFQYV